MDKITTQTIVEKTVYKTLDGKIFDNEMSALVHEEYIVIKEKVDKIKSVYSDEDNLIHNKVYYIENMDEFMNIIRYLGLNGHPRRCFDETEYRGVDWYFFYHECDDHGYEIERTETLTEKKQEWEEYCKRFTI